MIEIERKFIVTSKDWESLVISKSRITQGYLSDDPERVIRVRTRQDLDSMESSAFITIKGKKIGASCPEFEYGIPVEDAENLMPMALGSIAKIRHIVPYVTPYDSFLSLKWEIDVFDNRKDDLVIAEIELPSEDFEIILPSWCGREVTHDPAYSNLRLAGLDKNAVLMADVITAGIILILALIFMVSDEFYRIISMVTLPEEIPDMIAEIFDIDYDLMYRINSVLPSLLVAGVTMFIVTPAVYFTVNSIAKAKNRLKKKS